LLSPTLSLVFQVGSVRFSVTLADWIHLIVFKGFWFICHVVIPVYNFGLFSHRSALWFVHGGGRCLLLVFLAGHGVPCLCS
jgi:hypothetical protein